VRVAARSALAGSEIFQVGFVVADLDASLRAFARSFGLSSWLGWNYDGELLGWRSFEGEPAEFSMRLAIAGEGPQVELIEAVDGPDVYSGWLAEGEPARLHHFGFVVDSFEATRERLQAEGAPLVMAAGGHGIDGDGAFGYFDTRGSGTGLWTEVIQPARERRVPGEVIEIEGV